MEITTPTISYKGIPQDELFCYCPELAKIEEIYDRLIEKSDRTVPEKLVIAMRVVGNRRNIWEWTSQQPPNRNSLAVI